VRLDTGETFIADENYLRQSILDPGSQVVAGFEPIMPTYEGQLTEDQLLQLVAYIKAIGNPDGATP
jgi:cytochrome c oxidase subunit 2